MKLTRRGKIVAWVAGLLAFYFLYWLINHIWWTDNGYCLGSMEKCLGL
jgi:hypothetical protein